MICSLCKSTALPFSLYKGKEYFKCPTCKGVLMNPENYVSEAQEIIRYETHHNDVNDIRYQNFVSPIVNGILADFEATSIGLDFGCGTGPVITKMLRDANYTITTYDSFFDNNIKALENTYDFIACCEVIEHFHHPHKEFQLLKSLLKPRGKLYCMTDLFSDELNFEKWYYKNDETHVFFYLKETFNWIQKEFNLSKVTVTNRLIVFEN